MSHAWILVADSSRARIFEAKNAIGPLTEIEDLMNPESRMHEQNLTSDLPGRAYDSHGSNRHAMEEKTSAKDHEAENFAKLINRHLEKLRTKGMLKKLVVAAAPSFLGVLRKKLNANMTKLISTEIDKNLVQLDILDVRKHLPERI